ncbi:MFS transporter [Wenjunlia vitaminophila]|uniref:MFS transporter n=1 Tax=Wenjunlia vitaminophila TaxID=76728 RepID=UPI0003642B6F
MGGVDRRFRALVAAHAVSSYGNYLNLIALSLFSYEVAGTAFGVGAVMALRLFSGFLAGLVAGGLLARATRRTVMVCTDVAQVTAMAVLAMTASHTPPWLLGCAVVVMGAGNTLFNVSLRSAVPVMVGQEARARANGLLVAARSWATVLGFASAAPVIGFGGYATAFAVNAASFAVSAAALLVLRPRTDDRGAAGGEVPGPSAEQGAGASSRPAAGGRPGLAALGVPALLAGMIALRALDALASSSHNVALPVVADSNGSTDPAVFMTQFWAAWAVGTFLAQQVLRRRTDSSAWGARAFAVGTCAMSISFVLAFTGLPAVALVLASVSAGFADGCTEIVYTSRLQATPDRQRSRLFGLSATAETSGFTVGTVSAAAALEALPALVVVGAFHGVAVCGALVLLALTTVSGGTAPPRSSTSADEGEESHGTRPGAGTVPGA